MEDVLRDDWDKHWTDIASATEAGPAPKYRTRLILDLLELHRTGADAQLLDIGSGLGDFAAAARRRFPALDIVGLELSGTGVAIASKKVPSARFYQRDLLREVQPADIERIRATHVCCSEVLEHLDDPGALLGNAVRYLAPGCRCVFTVPGGPMSEFYRHIGHRRHYSPRELAQLLENSGFAVERVIAHGFPFFNLFRVMVTLRGRALIQDVTLPSGQSPVYIRVGNVLFDALLRLNLSFWGWQSVAIARWPGA
jgi:SAM-dependent methyltransferase